MFHRKQLYRVFLFLFIIMFSFLLILFHLQKEEKFSFSYSETSLYVPYLNGELLELTESGAVYRYGVTRKKQELLSHSDIIFISVMLDQNEDTYVLSTHKDGTLGISKDFSFEEKTLTHMEGLKKAELCEWGLIALTKDGAVYEYEGNLKEIEDGKEKVCLYKNENLPECKDFSVSIFNRAVLTKEGKVYVKGNLYGNIYKEYEELSCFVPIDAISISISSVLALSEDRKMFLAGYDISEAASKTKTDLTEVTKYKNVKQMVCEGNQVILLDNDGQVYFFGLKEKGRHPE